MPMQNIGHLMAYPWGHINIIGTELPKKTKRAIIKSLAKNTWQKKRSFVTEAKPYQKINPSFLLIQLRLAIFLGNIPSKESLKMMKKKQIIKTQFSGLS